jgi:hypothetical protein
MIDGHTLRTNGFCGCCHDKQVDIGADGYQYMVGHIFHSPQACG